MLVFYSENEGMYITEEGTLEKRMITQIIRLFRMREVSSTSCPEAFDLKKHNKHVYYN